MDDLDDDIPDLVPVSDSELIGGAGVISGAPVIQAQQRLEKPVPVTLITGFLGAGKSTLVNYILSEHHGYRIAVILNEIGDQKGIEKALLQDEGGGTQKVDEWVELTNGCLCCSVKDDFVNALESLMLQQTVFDYILIETTGLANPGPVAASLWVDEEIEANVVLDCIVTVVDAKNIRRQLTGNAPPGTSHGDPTTASPPDPPAGDSQTKSMSGTPVTATEIRLSLQANPNAGETANGPAVNEAQQQVAYADVLLLNKTDLVSPAELADVRGALLRHNAAADIVECHNSRVDLARILDRGSYKRAALEAADVRLPPEAHAAAEGAAEGDACGHAGCPGGDGIHPHNHGPHENGVHGHWPHGHGAHGADDHAHDHAHHHAHENGAHRHAHSHDHAHGHAHGHTHAHDHGHGVEGGSGAAAPISHDPDVTTVTLRIEEPVQLEGVRAWMDTLLWESAAVLDIYRVKGLVSVAGSDRKHGLQAVHELYDVAEGPPWAPGEDRCTRIVVIGRHLSHPELLRSLRIACLPA